MMLSRKYCGFNRFGGCGQEHWPLKIDHIWMVNCHTQMVSTDGFGNGTMVVAGFGFYNVLQLVLCLIMKIPMKQPVQGISERFLPLFGWFEGKSIFGAAFRVLIICLLLKQILVGARNGQDFHGFPPSFPRVPGTVSWNTLGGASRWRTWFKWAPCPATFATDPSKRTYGGRMGDQGTRKR